MLMTPPPARRVAVRRERAPLRMRAVVTQVVTKRLGALPVVAEFLHRLRVAESVDGLCPVRDLALATHGEVIEALVANRLTSPRPLVRVQDWARTWAVKEALDLDPDLLNDDRLGRALDAIAPHLAKKIERAVQASPRHFREHGSGRRSAVDVLGVRRDAGDEQVGDGFGVGADVVGARVGGCAEECCFDGVGVERAGAGDGEVVQGGVRDRADASGGDEPAEEVLDAGSQGVDESVDDEAYPGAVDRSFMVHDPHHLGIGGVAGRAPGGFDLGQGVFHRRVPEPFLRAEARDEQGMADARAAGELADRGPFVPVLGERVEGDLEQAVRVGLLAAARAAAAAAAVRLLRRTDVGPPGRESLGQWFLPKYISSHRPEAVAVSTGSLSPLPENCSTV